MRLENFPQDVINLYDLNTKAVDGFVYVAVKKGMYGLPQACILAQELLEKRLAQNGYTQSIHTPGLWTYAWRPICFTLVVDDFGIKYVGEEHALHLKNTLEQNYKVTTDWTGN